MRRGGPIFLVLGLVFLLLIGGLAYVVFIGGGTGFLGGGAPVSTPVPVVNVYIAAQHINKDQEITEDLVTTISLPQDYVKPKMVTDIQLLQGKFAINDMEQGWLFSADMVTDRPGTGGSKVILPGQVAISVPANRLDMVGYGIKDGDFVDVIATTMFVDLDASFQSKLPNLSAPVVIVGAPDGTNSAATPLLGGRAELDPTLNQVIYWIPSQEQRPRLVSQIILQDIQVLHVGTFPLASAQPTPNATQQSGGSAPTPVPAAVVAPDIITLIVSPQDAVSLTYFLYTSVKLSFALRAPDDRSRADTEAATLQYILSQYAIPVPAKLPYGFEPAHAALPVYFDINVTLTPKK